MRVQRVIATATAVITAALLCACSPEQMAQGTFRDAAAALPAPADFTVLAEPTEICSSARDLSCDAPGIVTTFLPTRPVDATELCATFLDWAAAQGVTQVFVEREVDWPGWYSHEVHSMVMSGSIPTGDVAAPSTVTDCAVAISRTLTSDPDVGHDRFDIVGLSGVHGVAGGLLILRLMPPRRATDGAILHLEEPYMIAAYYDLL